MIITILLLPLGHISFKKLDKKFKVQNDVKYAMYPVLRKY
jgi:hypothetical protein